MTESDTDLIHKLTYALEDVRALAQCYYNLAPAVMKNIMGVVDAALRNLCPQCRHRHELEDGYGVCMVVCPPEPGENEPWPCRCSHSYHDSSERKPSDG